jgi:DNA polymerase-4
VRFADFETIDRSRSLDRPVATAAEIAEVAVDLLASLDLARGVRLLGVSVSHLAESDGEQAVQLGLFGPAAPGAPVRGGDVETAADEIRRRFGPDAITSVAAAGRRAARARRRPGREAR